MKPVSKSEARWLYWRNHNPSRSNLDRGVGKYAKRQMNRLRRRFYKKKVAEWQTAESAR